MIEQPIPTKPLSDEILAKMAKVWAENKSYEAAYAAEELLEARKRIATLTEERDAARRELTMLVAEVFAECPACRGDQEYALAPMGGPAGSTIEFTYTCLTCGGLGKVIRNRKDPLKLEMGISVKEQQ